MTAVISTQSTEKSQKMEMSRMPKNGIGKKLSRCSNVNCNAKNILKVFCSYAKKCL